MIQAAFNVALNHRLDNLTARTVAKELKSSVAPIYSYFESMDELTQAVIDYTKNLLIDYTKKPYTDSIWLNMGTGIIFFARDYSNIYRTLFLERNYLKEIISDFGKSMDIQMKKDKIFSSMKVDDRKRLLNNMWMITHGFAALICAGIIEDTSDEVLISRLYEIGEIITFHAIKKSKSAD